MKYNYNVTLNGGNMFKKWFHRIANKYGYFQLCQIKSGGNCGCCGKWIADLIYVDYGTK
jgi:hypothetical protein